MSSEALQSAEVAVELNGQPDGHVRTAVCARNRPPESRERPGFGGPPRRRAGDDGEGRRAVQEGRLRQPAGRGGAQERPAARASAVSRHVTACSRRRSGRTKRASRESGGASSPEARPAMQPGTDGIASALACLGVAQGNLGQVAEALASADEALELKRLLADKRSPRGEQPGGDADEPTRHLAGRPSKRLASGRGSGRARANARGEAARAGGLPMLALVINNLCIPHDTLGLATGGAGQRARKASR